MFREMLGAKLHNATVTEANLHYVGSITIDRALMDAVGMLPNEKVLVVNNHNGARFETYIIEGEENSGTICLNGAAARLVQPGDRVIIMSFVHVENQKAADHEPRIALLDEKNRISKVIAREEAGQSA